MNRGEGRVGDKSGGGGKKVAGVGRPWDESMLYWRGWRQRLAAKEIRAVSPLTHKTEGHVGALFLRRGPGLVCAGKGCTDNCKSG